MSAARAMEGKPPTIVSFVNDLPNLCSLTGLGCSLLAIYFGVTGAFPAAMIALIWAVFFDWGDGIIARRISGRTQAQRNFGAQLDSLIDLVSFGVCPAVILASYGGFEWWVLPGAFVILAASALRLSFFNVYGLADESSYFGLALDNNAIVLVALFLVEPVMEGTVFCVVLYVTLMALTVLNVLPIKTPKLQGRWFYVLASYSSVISILYGWQIIGLPGV